MKANITIGSVQFDITDATAFELLEFARGGNIINAKNKDVVAVAKEAISTPAVKVRKRNSKQSPVSWAPEDVLFMAKLAVQMDPTEPLPVVSLTKAMLNKPSNTRAYDTIYAQAHSILRYIRLGTPNKISKSNVAMLKQHGFTPGMLGTSAATTNRLGDVRYLQVQQA